MRRRLWIGVALLAAAAIALGIARGDARKIYANARAICYSCIGLE
jgi:hypothetical protein